MSFTLDPEVAEAFAPFAAEAAGSTPPPVGDVASRRATFGGIFGYGDTGQPFPDDVAITDHELTLPRGLSVGAWWRPRTGRSQVIGCLEVSHDANRNTTQEMSLT